MLTQTKKIIINSFTLHISYQEKRLTFCCCCNEGIAERNKGGGGGEIVGKLDKHSELEESLHALG